MPKITLKLTDRQLGAILAAIHQWAGVEESFGATKSLAMAKYLYEIIDSIKNQAAKQGKGL